jgi:phage shock protein A
MGIVKRLGRTLSSNVSSLLDKVENPAKLAELALADMDKALRQGKRSQTEVRGDAKLHEQRATMLRRDADGWYQKAAVALRAGEEALARDALAKRHQLLTQAVAEDEAVKEAKDEEQEITRQLARLQVERDTFAARKGTLVTQAELSRASGKGLAGKLGASGKGPTPLEQYEEFEKQADAAEAEQEIDEMLGVGKEAELEGRFRQLQAGAGVDDELAALKARLASGGKGPQRDK